MSTDTLSDDRFAVTIPEAARLTARGGRRRKRKKGKGYYYEGASSIYEMIDRGELEAVKDGSRTLITMESIRRRMAALPRVQPKGLR
jgi:hypothetical protein